MVNLNNLYAELFDILKFSETILEATFPDMFSLFIVFNIFSISLFLAVLFFSFYHIYNNYKFTLNIFFENVL